MACACNLNECSFPGIKLFFEDVPIEAFEGDSGVQVCVRLGGTNWLDLERDLLLELNSDGGIIESV